MCIRFSTMNDFVKRLVLTTVILSCVYSGCDSLNRLQMITNCIQRKYDYYVNKTTVIGGRTLRCEGHVPVISCWGRCVSFEYGDFKIPYKKSIHPVCMYNGTISRIVTIPNCHVDHPDPTYEVFDAQACGCEKCNSTTTSCENLKG